MKKTVIILLLLLIIPISTYAWTGKVVGVTDGDTIKVLSPDYKQVKIRLYGIDTPEKAQPYGQAAGKYLASLVAGAVVEVESVATDRYGRTVGIVSNREANINQEMVRSGYAWVYQRYCDKPFCDFWLLLEKEARSDKIGLWQEPNPIPPWEWRKRK